MRHGPHAARTPPRGRRRSPCPYYRFSPETRIATPHTDARAALPQPSLGKRTPRRRPKRRLRPRFLPSQPLTAPGLTPRRKFLGLFLRRNPVSIVAFTGFSVSGWFPTESGTLRLSLAPIALCLCWWLCGVLALFWGVCVCGRDPALVTLV